MPGVVTRTEPPAPVPAVVLEISAPLSSWSAVLHNNRTGIAARRRCAKAVIPLPGSVKVNGPCAVICTLPPFPSPAVRLAICAPPSTVRALALTITEPPGPDCRPVAEAAIWVPDHASAVEHQHAGCRTPGPSRRRRFPRWCWRFPRPKRS